MIENDDDWELFVPVKGEKYPDACQYKYRRIDHEWSEWCRGPIGVADYPRNDTYQYRRPKQKETKMPDRTPQQALKDAMDSGAVEAWINGEKTQCAVNPDNPASWVFLSNPEAFHNPRLFHRVRPPEPTKINWQPVVTGKEPKGVVLGYWDDDQSACSVEYTEELGWHSSADREEYFSPSHWAPKYNLPEGDK